MDPSFLTFLQNRSVIVDPMYVAAVALAIYDYILTLHLEIKYVWFSKWTYTKLLFLLIRYVTFANLPLVLYGHFFVNVSVGLCNGTSYAAAWGMFIKTALAESILCLRTWAVWGRNKVVGIFLVVPMLIYFGVAFYLETEWIHSLQIGDSPYPGFRGCFWTGASNTMWMQFIPLLGVETIVLAFMATSALRLYRVGSGSEFYLVVHMDGILFYVYLLVLTATNIVIACTVSADIMGPLALMEDVMYSVFTTRIVLNIRSVGHNKDETELHTFQPARLLPFVSNEHHREPHSDN